MCSPAAAAAAKKRRLSLPCRRASERCIVRSVAVFVAGRALGGPVVRRAVCISARSAINPHASAPKDRWNKHLPARVCIGVFTKRNGRIYFTIAFCKHIDTDTHWQMCIPLAQVVYRLSSKTRRKKEAGLEDLPASAGSIFAVMWAKRMRRCLYVIHHTFIALRNSLARNGIVGVIIANTVSSKSPLSSDFRSAIKSWTFKAVCSVYKQKKRCHECSLMTRSRFLLFCQ